MAVRRGVWIVLVLIILAVGVSAMGLVAIALMVGHEPQVEGNSTLAVGAESRAPRRVVLGVRPADLRLAEGGLAAKVERIEDLGDSAIVKANNDGKAASFERNLVATGWAVEFSHLGILALGPEAAPGSTGPRTNCTRYGLLKQYRGSCRPALDLAPGNPSCS